MYTNKIEEDLNCGIRVAFKVFGGKWKLCLIDAINRGITRPNEIYKEINTATQRVLEMQLAELLHYGVVTRESEDNYPKRSEYHLTPLGKSLLPLLVEIDKWGTANAAFIQARHLELEETEA
jgi:DNA-binding HxlR family transcriptional regulator